MEFTKLSIKNFIGDLPRILNKNFDALKTVLDNIVDNKDPKSAAHTISASAVNVTGVVDANTISANNIVLKITGKKYSLVDLIARVEELEETLKN